MAVIELILSSCVKLYVIIIITILCLSLIVLHVACSLPFLFFGPLFGGLFCIVVVVVVSVTVCYFWAKNQAKFSVI